jgi:diguanylate cyclase (GGDEF)-like protein/PAS domain S-box-containing protein
MPSINDLTLCDIMSTRVHTLSPEQTLDEALRMMAEERVSCLTVMRDGQPIGILTEQDVVRLFTTDAPLQTPVTTHMTTPAVTAPSSLDFRSAYHLLLGHRIRHLIVVDENGRQTGIVSETDFRSHLGLDLFRMTQNLRSAMETHFAALPQEAPLCDVIRRMAEAKCDFVLAMREGHACGILTERDIPRLLARHLDTATIQLQEVMSSPVKTISIHESLARAADLMSSERIRHMAVMDEQRQIVGVLSQHRLLERLGGVIIEQAWEDRRSAELARIHTQLLLGMEHEFARLLTAELDREAILQAMLEAALRLPELDGGGLFRQQQQAGGYSLMHQRGLSTSLIDLISHLSSASLEAGIIRQGSFLCNRETETPLCQHSDLFASQPVRDAGIRAIALLPLKVDGDPIACLYLVSQQVDALAEDTVTALDTLSRQFTQALEKFTALAQARSDQEALRHSETLLRTVVHTIPDLIWLKDPDGVFLACNPTFERLFGAAQEEIVGSTDYDFVAQEIADSFRATDLAAIEAGQSRINEEWLNFAADGYRGLFETIKTPMFDDQHRLIGVLSIARDMTERRRTEAALRSSEETLRALINAMPDIVCFKDGDGRWLLANDFDLQLFQLEGVDYRGKKDCELAKFSPFYQDAFMACEESDEQAWRMGSASRSDEIIPRPGGPGMIFDVIKVPTFQEDGQRKGLIVVGRDITERKCAEEQLHRLAHYDPLTQLPNRVLLSDRLQIATAHAKRSGKLLAICYLDLDGFKPVNDHHGHDIGDRLLIDVAHRLTDALRAGDSIGRLGGDEFVLLLGDLGSEGECRTTLERVLKQLSKPYRIDGLELTLTASIGVTLYPSDITDSDTLLRHADQAMYQAKEAGRDRYHFFDPQRDQRMRDLREAQLDIRQALRNGEMTLHYQPKVNMRHGQVYGVEALIRWQHPQRGVLPPLEFLPKIADTEIAVEIDHWVLEQAFEQACEWRSAGLPLTVSINISARTLGQEDFQRRLSALLPRYPDLPHNTLELEILESVALDDIARVSAVMEQCRKLGLGFALDDFGTGYSSLLYLRHLPASMLKVDQSFVRDMLDDSGDRSIIEGIIGLADAFQCDVIAEGVEGEEHGVLLLQLGCSLAQGFGIARPMPAAEIPVWIEQYRQPASWSHYREFSGPHPDLPLLLMGIEHKRWIDGVISLLEREHHQDLSIADVELNTHECRLGRWYYGPGMHRFGHRPHFLAMEGVHEHTHKLARDIIGLWRRGRMHQAVELKQALLAKRDELLGCLESLREYR